MRIRGWWGWLGDRAKLYGRLSIADALSDSELFLRFLESLGIESLDELVGEYSVHILDNENHILIRDGLGVVPLFFGWDNKRRLVSSPDISEVMSHSPDTGVRSDIFLQNLAGASFSDIRTQFRGVYRVPPGHAVKIGTAETKVIRYFRPETWPARWEGSFAEAVDELDRRLQSAVDDSVVPGSRVGLHISGGLDSGVVAAMAAKLAGNESSRLSLPVAVTWIPGEEVQGKASDEQKAVDLVAQHIGVTPLPIADPDALRVQQSTQDPLIFHPGTTSLYEHIAAQHYETTDVDVVLSGWGGDEIVSSRGRLPFRGLLRRHKWADAGRELTVSRRNLFSSLKEMAPKRLQHKYARTRQFSDPLAKLWLAQAPELLTQHPHFAPPVATTREVQLFRMRTGHLGMRTEAWWQIGHRHGYEYRYPLLDMRVVRLALSLPEEFYQKEGQRRRLFRALASRYLPASVAANAKIAEPIRVRQYLESRVSYRQQVEAAYPEVAHIAAIYDTQLQMIEDSMSNDTTSTGRKK